ncbi:phage integrase central domain-containing protein [Novosphingobium rhizovicinum]|uniref:phage integrase central domain-containing protein n=1 Tax=Novosphingobium rhizovicinum TaxID=3228928 RepID=UPI003B01E537
MQKQRRLLDFAYPLIGNRPVSDVSAPELLTVLRTVDVRIRHPPARRLRNACGSVLRYAHRPGTAERMVRFAPRSSRQDPAPDRNRRAQASSAQGAPLMGGNHHSAPRSPTGYALRARSEL